MAEYKNINKSANVVSVGRTAPVPRGVQSKNNSLPVVLASDADPIPVVEQNKVLSEVALSLLGIPRSEVALGIFADVNTYDVNPSEWSIKPLDRSSFNNTTVERPFDYSQATASTTFQHGLSHIPEEAGALVEAPPGKSAVLTSKRFFRYQPGRVSAATFGVKESVVDHIDSGPVRSNRNPAIRKFGIYDNFDGYYWETRDTGKGDQFCVTRRTQSIIDDRRSPTEFSTSIQTEDYAIVGKGNSTELTSVMTANTASSTGTVITIPTANIDNEPEIGMTIQNITHQNGVVANTDDTPLFAESTVVTAVATIGSNYSISLNRAPITSAINATAVTGDFSNKRLKFTRAGELVIVRDGILMTQGGIYDPTLLRDETLNKISSVTGDKIYFDSPASGATDSPEGLLAHRVFNFGQLVEYTTNASPSVFRDDADGLTNETLVHQDSPSIMMIREIGTAENYIKLSQIPSVSNTNESPSFFVPPANTATFSTTSHFIKTPVPFIFPEIVSENSSGTENTATANVNDIMFPYSRGFDINRNAITSDFSNHKGESQTAGLIDTNLAGTSNTLTQARFDNFKADINDLNRGLTACTMKSGLQASSNQTTSSAKITSGWRYWIQQNVKPDFYGVYEYKIPRSRFSFDSLDGKTDSAIVYSDIVKDGGSTKYPGQAVIGDSTVRNSLWDIDFSKVIMKKIEFSWYGAVGALFLAYVPVGNGEARWVRVHHLRASNQLKVASLGNATLPLTYTVFGGGTPKQLGNSSFRTTGYAGGRSLSEFVTKYGSSYYIDGGDRGTVRLFNFAPAAPTSLKTSSIPVTLNQAGSASKFTFNYSPTGNSLDIKPTDLFIGGIVKNSANPEATAKVEWVERKGYNNTPYVATMHLNKQFTNTAPVRVLVEPGINLYGVESKTEIQSSQEFLVRNRVQVYPTKLSVGMVTAGGQTENVSLKLKKNVKFQTDEVFKLKYNKNSGAPGAQDGWVFKNDCPLASAGLPTRLVAGSNYSPQKTAGSVSGVDDCPNIPVGTEFFGHARVADALDNEFTLFGKIKKVDIDSSDKAVFDFIPLEPYTGVTKFVADSTFTYSLQYRNNPTNDSDTKTYVLQSAITPDTEEIERLSSVTIDNQIRRSIPNTGTAVSSFFLEDGSDYFDLSAYFDYNKDYISFPLTDVPDNLYLEAKIDSPKGPLSAQINPKIVASLTWEEQ